MNSSRQRSVEPKSRAIAQIRSSLERDLPLVIHTREAWDDTFAILETEGVPRRTIFHCFTGGQREAERALAIGTRLHVQVALKALEVYG